MAGLANITGFHALQEKWGALSLVRVMVSTYIKFGGGFSTYKAIKTHVEEAIKCYKNWQRDKSNLMSNGYPISTLLDASSCVFSSVSIFFRKMQKMFDKWKKI